MAAAPVPAGGSERDEAPLATGFFGRLLLTLRGPRSRAPLEEGALRIGIMGAGTWLAPTARPARRVRWAH